MNKRNMSKDLTAEELAFLRKFLTQPEADEQTEAADNAAAPTLAVDPFSLDEFSDETGLLKHILAKSDVKLQATWGDYTLTFSPSLEASRQDSVPKIRFGFPEIKESNAGQRALRVPVNNEKILLRDDAGLLQQIELIDISTQGCYIYAQFDQPLKAGQLLDQLWLECAHGDAFPITAVVSRLGYKNARQTVALRFESCPTLLTQALSAYIFKKQQSL